MAQRRVGDIPALEEQQVLGYYLITGQQEKTVALYDPLDGIWCL